MLNQPLILFKGPSDWQKAMSTVGWYKKFLQKIWKNWDTGWVRKKRRGRHNSLEKNNAPPIRMCMFSYQRKPDLCHSHQNFRNVGKAINFFTQMIDKWMLFTPGTFFFFWILKNYYLRVWSIPLPKDATGSGRSTSSPTPCLPEKHGVAEV